MNLRRLAAESLVSRPSQGGGPPLAPSGGFPAWCGASLRNSGVAPRRPHRRDTPAGALPTARHPAPATTLAGTAPGFPLWGADYYSSCVTLVLFPGGRIALRSVLGEAAHILLIECIL